MTIQELERIAVALDVLLQLPKRDIALQALLEVQ